MTLSQRQASDLYDQLCKHFVVKDYPDHDIVVLFPNLKVWHQGKGHYNYVTRTIYAPTYIDGIQFLIRNDLRSYIQDAIIEACNQQALTMFNNTSFNWTSSRRQHRYDDAILYVKR